MRVIDDIPIPMADGCRLAARLWLPEGAERDPVPAIVEYIPYRKGDATAIRDSVNHGHFAAHGYACLRVDMRGSGDSEGVMAGFGTRGEADDGVAVIDWAAGQPWCSGAVGMLGLSWGARAALAVAARRPRALKAVVAVCAPDARLRSPDDHPAGAMLAQSLGRAAWMLAYAARPPDPAAVGVAWRAMWRQRLDAAEPPLARRLAARRDGGAAGDMGEDRGSIACPVYAVGGWADPWRGVVLDLLERARAPVKGLIGPWGHGFPHSVPPGPGIDFLGECLRWWDHWLKGAATGVMDEPRLKVFIEEARPPSPKPAPRAGRWIGLARWPAPEIAARTLYLTGDGGLADRPGAEAACVLRSPQTTGLDGGEQMPWFACGPAPELAGDQRDDDARSALFDTAPFEDAVTILGAPSLSLDLAEPPHGPALIAARLCDLAPDGASTLIARGLAALPAAGGGTALELALAPAGYRLPAGHRLRLALSNAYWPLAWPPPEATALALRLGRARLDLPLLAADAAEIPPFDPPRGAAPRPAHLLRAPRARRTQDRSAGLRLVEEDHGLLRLEDTGLVFGSKATQRFRIEDDDPLSAEAAYGFEHELARGDWRVLVRSRMRVTATRTHFLLRSELEAWEGDRRVFRRRWRRRLARGGY